MNENVQAPRMSENVQAPRMIRGGKALPGDKLAWNQDGITLSGTVEQVIERTGAYVENTGVYVEGGGRLGSVDNFYRLIHRPEPPLPTEAFSVIRNVKTKNGGCYAIAVHDGDTIVGAPVWRVFAGRGVVSCLYNEDIISWEVSLSE